MADTIKISPAVRIRGMAVIPGDKSLSHRALIFAAMANGRSRIENLATGADVRSTINVLRDLGITIVLDPDGDSALVDGRGGIFDQPSRPLNCGNSATTLSLMAGLLAAQPFESELVGDESLMKRPMKYIAEPLRLMGADVSLGEHYCPPLIIHGGELTAIAYKPPIASAQVKSTTLLAGLFARGSTVYHENRMTRDHTERMLQHFCGNGAVTIDRPSRTIKLQGGGVNLRKFEMVVPGDPSSAAFPIALATMLPESTVTIPFVGLNGGRISFYRQLQAMGAHIVITPDAHAINSTCGEPVGEITVISSKLKNVPVDPDRIPSMIDELPLMSVVASLSEREWEFTGASRLREKETDRINTTAEMLKALGCDVEILPDGLRGPGEQKFTGGTVQSYGDHRIAMSAAIAGWCAGGPVEITSAASVGISFPSFFDQMQDLVEYQD